MSSIGKSSTQILLARITKDIQVHVLEREALEVKQAKGLASQQEVERISELKDVIIPRLSAQRVSIK